MSEYYHIVPWYDSQEWHQVYDKLYSSTSSFLNKEESLHILLLWKARCPSLPSGVESTLTLLEVHVQDIKNSDDIVNEQLLRLAYSSALMRFVNHMLDTETAKGSSLYRAAKNKSVPDWIIDMRHDTAHNNNLPSIELLREASLIGLDWLQKHYWDEYSQHIQDYLSGQKETDTNNEYKIAALMSFCISLSICAHSQCTIKNLSDIPDARMRESIVNDARALFGDQIDLSNLKTVSMMSLVNIMNVQSKKLLKTKDVASHVNKALLGEDSLFMSLELLNYLGHNDFRRKSQLNTHYLQCFEVLLTFLHTNDLLLDFILELVKLSQSTEYEGYQCHLAALWLSEIFKALRRCKNFIDRINKINADEMSPKKRNEFKALFHHWFPNEKANGLLLDLQKPVPSELMNINYIQPIISSYNPYATYFIKDLLNLVEPHLPKTVAEKICNLAKLISSPNNFTATGTKIYTVDDLKITESMSSSLEHDYDSDCYELNESHEKEVTTHSVGDQPSSGIWRLASNKHSWGSCPIGKLPWQQKKDNPVPMDTSL